MNEEERIIRSIKYIINQNYVDTEDDIIGILIKALNLIEKQSKEIEGLIEVSKECIEEKFNNDNKWEDKIKAKIEIRKEEKENCKDSIEEKYLLREIYVLQSLLEKE